MAAANGETEKTFGGRQEGNAGRINGLGTVAIEVNSELKMILVIFRETLKQ